MNLTKNVEQKLKDHGFGTDQFVHRSAEALLKDGLRVFVFESVRLVETELGGEQRIVDMCEVVIAHDEAEATKAIAHLSPVRGGRLEGPTPFLQTCEIRKRSKSKWIGEYIPFNLKVKGKNRPVVEHRLLVHFLLQKSKEEL